MIDEKTLDQLIEALWEKHAHPDRHGYKDWMSDQGFDAAIRELVAKLVQK